MTKTFKTCAIFSITAVWLILMRILFGAVNLSDNVNDWLFSVLVQIVGMGLIPILLYKFWVKGSIKKGFSLRSGINPAIYPIAIAIGIVMHFLVRSISVLWQSVAFLTGYVPSNRVGTIYSSPEVLVFDIICTAVLPGIFEELNYRGLGMAMLENVEDEKIKVVVIGLLFGLGHQFVLQTGYAFAAGMVFAFLALKTKSILPGMIIHFTNNFLSVLSEYSKQKNNGYYAFESVVNNLLFRSYGSVICVLVVSAAATVALCLLAKKLADQKPVKEEEEEKSTYFYPNTAQYIDDIFGKNFFSVGAVSTKKKTAWYEYAFLYAAIAVMAATTVFSYLWGLMR